MEKTAEGSEHFGSAIGLDDGDVGHESTFSVDGEEHRVAARSIEFRFIDSTRVSHQGPPAVTADMVMDQLQSTGTYFTPDRLPVS